MAKNKATNRKSLAMFLLATGLAACGGGEEKSSTSAHHPDSTVISEREVRNGTSSQASFDPDHLPLDAKLDPATTGPPFRSHDEGVEAFLKAYRKADLDELQKVWSRMSAAQRLEGYDRGQELSDRASMDDYKRMLPAQYLLDAENLSELEAAAEREARANDPSLGIVRGRVVEKGTNQPVGNLYLTVGNATATSSKDGTFEAVGVRPGTVSISGFLHSYKPVAQEIEVAAGRTVEITVYLEPSRTEIPASELGILRGVIVDKETQEPIEGMEVLASFSQNAAKILMGDAAKWGAVTASDGSFEIADIPAGPVVLMGQKPPYFVQAHQVTITGSQTTEERIEVQRLGVKLKLPTVVTGTVRDALTGEPVAGVHVSAGPYSGATSDKDGRYFIRKAKLGDRELIARHDDYHDWSEPIRIDEPGRIDRDISIQPITTGSIVGVAVDRTTGEPIAHAVVVVAGQTLETDAEGRFRLDELEAGEIAVQASGEGYRAYGHQVVLKARSTAETLLELDPITEGTVTGIVTDAATGNALEAVWVQIGPLTAKTGPDGRFELTDVPAGDTSITAGKAVYETTLETIAVKAAEAVEIELSLEPVTVGVVEGVVLAAGTHRPVANAEVSIGNRHTRAGADGRFRIEDVESGDAMLTAQKAVFEPGHATARVVAAETVAVEIELSPITYGRVTGRVIDADSGRPIAGADVSLGEQRLTSGPDGRFEAARVAAGDVAVSARKAAYRSGGVSVELEPAGSAEAVVELEPIKVGTVVGVVVDAKTGQPIPGARVACGSRSVEADDRGRFHCDEVNAGVVGVNARHADYGDGAVSGELTGAGTLELEVRLDLRREDVTQLESALTSKGTIDLYGIHFDSGKDQFKPSSLGTLNAVLKVIQRAPEKTFQIAGHTDSDGSEASNQDLSERRAGTVIRWLVERGIDAGRLQKIGFGESRPAAPNDTASGKALNRRVELSYAN